MAKKTPNKNQLATTSRFFLSYECTLQVSLFTNTVESIHKGCNSSYQMGHKQTLFHWIKTQVSVNNAEYSPLADAISVIPAPTCALCRQRMHQKGAEFRGAAETTVIKLGTAETELYYRRHRAPCIKLTSRKIPWPMQLLPPPDLSFFR